MNLVSISPASPKDQQQQRSFLINRLEQLEELFDLSYDIPNREEFSRFLFQHPLRFTPYLAKQIQQFPSIARQYLPDPRELEPIGLQKPFAGIMKTGIPGLERMYLDRVILMPTSQCFAYCRFCFRKNYSHDVRDGDFADPRTTLQQGIDYIRHDERIKEVLITGGDPLMFPEAVLDIIRELRTIPHLTGIRIGTRIFTSDPELITEEWIAPFSELNRFTDASALVAPVSISPHINHPDELSPETERALLLCTQNNVPLYNQTVLLKDINDNTQDLIHLNRRLRQLSVEPYRIYVADPLQGTEYLRTSLEKAFHIKEQLQAQCSGRIVPQFMIDTRIGKVDLSELQIIKRQGKTLSIRTPYSSETYQAVDKDWSLPEYCSVSEEGNLIVEWDDAQTT